MTVIQKIVREPNLVLGVVTSALSLMVLFGVNLTVDQMAGIGVFLGALITLIRFITTPASEVVAQVKPGGEIVAGPAAETPTGARVDISARPVHHTDEWL